MPVKTLLTPQSSNTRVPVKIWTDQVEPKAQTQLENTARLPFVFKHVAAMPDVHFGMGATIGSVIATKGAICPAAVGVDIGCGMMAVKTELNDTQVLEILPALRHSWERSVPVGFEANRKIAESVHKWPGWDFWNSEDVRKDSYLYTKALTQMGSLGGGNHFIELCLDNGNAVWVVLHSGSRGVGNGIAQRHIETAKGLMKRYFIELPDPDLAYFAEATPECDAYLKDLQWCQDYAFQNRIEMMNRCLKDLSHAIGFSGLPLTRLMEINCHHNYVEKENHYGENVFVTRKGAVRARETDYGIIPGSMGTRSYIVQGRGNEASFHSCSHGAGRRMSRTEARKRFTAVDLEDQTRGVECRKDLGVLDEIPGAYKDIDKVMEDQSDLVTVVATLKQVLCVKG